MQAKAQGVGPYNDCRPQTLLERLNSEKESLEKRLADVNDALAALDANPAVADALEKISKIGHF